MFSLLVSQLHRENGLGSYWIWMGGVYRGVVCSIQGHGEGGIGSGHCFFGENQRWGLMLTSRQWGRDCPIPIGSRGVSL
jgi:hypothetical protein